MPSVTQPEHDAFFKRSLQNKAIAIDFFKAHLPADILKRIDFASLKLTEKSFVAKDLKQLHSDLIYQCLIDEKPAYIYMLLEDQSRPEKLMAFRKLTYLIRLMEMHLRQGHKTLPIILPICVYHGKTSPYPYSTDIFDCFEDPTLAREVMFRPFQLIDLTILSDDEIAEHGLVAVMEMLMKHHRARDLAILLKRLLKEELLRHTLNQLQDDSYLTSVLYYVLSWGDRGNTFQVNDILDHFSESFAEKKEKIMTFADQLREQGHHLGMQQGLYQGIEQGMQQGAEQQQHAIAKKMLLKGRPINEIKDFTGLPLSKIKLIKTALPH